MRWMMRDKMKIISGYLNSQRKREKAQEGEESELEGREYTAEVIRTSEIVCGRAWLYIQRYSKN